MTIDRRTLIRRTCATAAAFAAKPTWAASGIFRGRGAAPAAASDTVLLVVDMNGGNDGLNTVVPFADSTYAAARSRIALAKSQLLPIDAKTGLHPSLAKLHGYLDSGKLAMTRVVLRPRVVFAGAAPSPDALADLHERSHRECFIANSVVTQVDVEARD